MAFQAAVRASASLALVALAGCGSSTQSASSPAVFNGQMVFEAPGIPGGNVIQELYTVNLDGSDETQITHDSLNEFLPHFSPDGRRVLYSKFLSGQYGDEYPLTDIFVYDFATRNETRLTTMENAFQPAWSPDGSRIAVGTYQGDALWMINADGSGLRLIAKPTGSIDDIRWADAAWSSDDWIIFTVAQKTNNCFKSRIDKIRPDGSARTQVTDGGPNCTPGGMENYGDADPGISADGKTIYSSRGLGRVPQLPSETLRHLYAVSSDAWTPGKLETDLSLAAKPDCVVGVPKGSPDGSQILVFLRCLDDLDHQGVTITDTAGSYWNFLVPGFGGDWNPVAKQ